MTAIDTVVFDKTGTLTLGRPELVCGGGPDGAALGAAAALAGASKHPLARALRRAAPDAPTPDGVEEVPGSGLRLATPEGEVRLGHRRWCGVPGQATGAMSGDQPRGAGPHGANPMASSRDGAGPTEFGPDGEGPELWFSRPAQRPVRFAFADELREDARQVVAALEAQGLAVEMLSGDRAEAARAVAAGAGFERWRAGCTPAEKAGRLGELAAQGRRALMVGDGLNDAPALAAAHVSMSPSTAADVSQTAADAIFQGRRLAPVLETLAVARAADRLVKQNFALAFLYNAVTVPLAVAGLVTPLIAAVAMSASSLVVTANALRLSRRGVSWGKRPWT
jgi:Cu2+-exporting ATPase